MASNRRMLKLLSAVLLVAACGGGKAHTDDAVDDDDQVTPDSDDLTVDPDGPATDSPPSGVDPSTTGTATVTTQTVTIPSTGSRSLDATVFKPSAPATNRPLVVILPGFQLDRTQYTSYAQHLASWGFVVILADYGDSSFSPDHAAYAADARKVVDYAVATTALAIDATKIGIAGHSLGGKISVLAAAGDPRIKAIVGWDPVDSTTNPAAPQAVMTLTAPLAVVGETTDGSGGQGGMSCAPTAENFLQFYAAAAAPAVAITVNGADHMDFVDDPSCFVCGFCTEGTADPSLARTVTKRLDVAWFRRQLLGDTAMDAWLYAPPEVAAGTVTVQHR